MTSKSLLLPAICFNLVLLSVSQAHAQWGRVVDVPPGPPSPHRRTPSRPNNNTALATSIIGLLDTGIKAAAQSGHNGGWGGHNRHRHDPWKNTWHDPWQRPSTRTVYVQPRVVQPQYVQPNAVQTQTVAKKEAEVKSNEAPVAKPKPKEKPVEVERNSFSLSTCGITSADIHNTKEDAKDHIDDTVDDIRDDITDKLKDDVNSLKGYSEAEKREIKDRLKKGESVDDLIKDNTEPSDAADRLRKAGDAFEELDEIADDAKKGRLDVDDLDDFENDFRDLVDSEDDLTDDLDVIAEDSFWVNQMENAHPGSGNLPFGTATQIIYVPNMPSEQVVDLGNGTLLVGTGGATSGVIATTGNAAQVAGLSVGIGQPVPDTQAEAILSGVLLLNAGDQTVNYNVNSDQFSMAPDFRQALPGGQTWEIEFDRGGEHGKAKYGIADGTYAFTPSDNGWELFEQSAYKVTIDNSKNHFPFNYVLNNTQQTVPAGQVQEHSSPYPLVVRFDDGSGQERSKQLDKGEYAVAITTEGSIDLFAPSEVEPPIRIEQIAKTPAMSGRSLLTLGGRGGLFGGNTASGQGGRGGLMSFR